MGSPTYTPVAVAGGGTPCRLGAVGWPSGPTEAAAVLVAGSAAVMMPFHTAPGLKQMARGPGASLTFSATVASSLQPAMIFEPL